jgi:hypothetical protein
MAAEPRRAKKQDFIVVVMLRKREVKEDWHYRLASKLL